MNTMRLLPARLLPALLVGILTGCVSSTTPVPDCCYQGPFTTSRLGVLELSTEAGTRIGFGEAFPGFAPREALFSTALPFDEVESQDIIYASLIPLLPIYDANSNGVLERPEVIVLFVREAARATGTALRHIGGDTPIWALSAPTADVGALVDWAYARLGTMDPEGQQIFRDLKLLGQDLRTRGSENGGDRTDIWI